MIEFIEASGKTEELAIASALTRLGLERDDVSVEILERAKSGVFGIGAKPARVKLSYEVPESARKPEAPKSEPAAAKAENRAPSPAPAAAEPAERAEPKPPRAAPEAPARKKAAPAGTPAAAAQPAADSPEEEIRSFLVGLLAQMEVEAELRISQKEEGGWQVFLEGERLGALIGHRGETLDAIQQLCSYSVNRNRSKRVRIHIDVEHYRAKREESLKRLANKVATKVVKYRRNITLEPMNAYERHVIHEALQDFPDVLTYSTGTEPNRRTVVAYSKGKHSY